MGATNRSIKQQQERALLTSVHSKLQGFNRWLSLGRSNELAQAFFVRLHIATATDRPHRDVTTADTDIPPPHVPPTPCPPLPRHTSCRR